MSVDTTRLDPFAPMSPREELSDTVEERRASQSNHAVNILVVDDEPGARETLVDIFEEMGYHAETAASAQQALALLAGRFFDVALLDIRLPDGYGTDLLARIREIHPDTKCIMATGYASKETSISALNAGAYAYIEKPLDMTLVSKTIQQAVEQQRLERENRALMHELEALRDVTDSALSSLELPEMLDRLLRTVVEHLSASAGVILLLNDEGRLEVAQAVGLDPKEWERFGGRLEEGFPGRVVQAEQGLVLHRDDPRSESADLYFRDEDVQSIFGVPLRAKGRIIGVAWVDALTRREFTPEDWHLFHALADRAAVLIDNARLYEEERRLRQRAQDIGEKQRRSAEEAQTLYEVAGALVASLELDERLQTIGEHLARVTGARRCFTLLIEQDALVLRAIYGGDDSDRETFLGERIDYGDIGPELRKVLDDAQTVVITDGMAPSFIDSELVRRWRMRSVLLLPLVYNRNVIGAIGLDEPGRTREFGAEERRLASIIAQQAAVAIENARTFEQERTVAQILQRSFLPPDRPDIPGYEVDCSYVPASDVMQVGGDYYDFLELGEGRYGIVLGDVCGKGVTAAVYTAMGKYMLRAYALENPDPGVVLTRLNRILFNQMSEECMFITLVYGVLDTGSGSFTYVNAAHPHPLLYHPAADRFQELETTGGMVGALPNMEFQTASVQLGPGSVLALFTDGVTEARVGADMLETSGVEAVIRETASLSPDGISQAIYERALKHSGGNLKDDVAIVVIKPDPSSD